MPSLLQNERWLQWVEQLVESSSPETKGEELPRSQFYCLLDDQPDHLAPPHSLSKWIPQDSAGHMMVNPSLSFAADSVIAGAGPSDASLLRNFALPHSVVWVGDPASDVLYPFWLGTKLRALVCGLQPGRPAPALSPEIHSLLTTAGILVPEDWELRRHKWLTATAQRAEAFQRNRYVPIPNLLHPFHIAALRRYYRHMVRNGGMKYGDSQAPRRFFAYNESVAQYFHSQWTGIVSAIVGEPVKPSYVYVACYQEGADLAKHLDREQCEFSITMCLDYTPEPRTCTPWPLMLQTAGGTASVFQALGDALLYRGREVPHWREPLRLGNTSSSIFFHYVRKDFNGHLG